MPETGPDPELEPSPELEAGREPEPEPGLDPGDEPGLDPNPEPDCRLPEPTPDAMPGCEPYPLEYAAATERSPEMRSMLLAEPEILRKICFAFD